MVILFGSTVPSNRIDTYTYLSIFNDMRTMHFNITNLFIIFQLNWKTKSHPNTFNHVILNNTGDVNLVNNHPMMK